MAKEDTEESSTDPFQTGRTIASAGAVWLNPQLAVVPGMLIGASSATSAAATLATAYLAASRSNEFDSSYTAELVKQFGWNSILANNTVDAQRAAVKTFIDTGDAPVAVRIAQGSDNALARVIRADWDSQVQFLAGSKSGQPWWDTTPRLLAENVNAVPRAMSRSSSITTAANKATLAAWRPLAKGVNTIVAPVLTSNVRPTSKFIPSVKDSVKAVASSIDDAQQATKVRDVFRHGSKAVVHGVQTPLRLARVAAKTAALGLLTGAAGTIAAQGVLRLGDDAMAELFDIEPDEVNRHLDTLFEGTGAIDPLTVYARTFNVIFNDLDEANQARGLHTDSTRGEFVNEMITEELKTNWDKEHELLPDIGMPPEVAETIGAGAELITDVGFFVVDDVGKGVEEIENTLENTAAVAQVTTNVAKNERVIDAALGATPIGRLLASLRD